MDEFFKPDQACTSTNYGIKSRKRRELNKKLGAMLAQDLRPVHITKGKGFRNFVKALDPNFVIPSPRTISQKILPSLDNVVMTDVLKELRKARHVALTTDGWTCSVADSYNTYTAHYFNLSTGKLDSKVLEGSRFDSSHTADNLKNDIIRVVGQFGLRDKLINITSDNAANIQKAIRDSGYDGFGCLAHGLNLAAKKGLSGDDLEALIRQVKGVTSFLHTSCNGKRFFCAVPAGMQLHYGATDLGLRDDKMEQLIHLSSEGP